MKAKVALGVAGALVVAFFLVAGALGLFRNSGGSIEGSSSSAGGSADSGVAQSAPSAATAPAGTAAQSNSETDLGKAGATAERDIVRTAQLSVTADDPTDAAQQAGTIATAAGGRVEQDNRDGSAHLVLRVPANRLDATLTQLAALGDLTAQQVDGDDVTAQTADLGARVKALQTSVDRLQTLISSSGNLANLLQVETQLTSRQAELESLQAQQRALADQVSLATITVDFVEPAVAAAKSEPTGFGGAVAGGWHGFTVTVRFVLAGLGYALPFLLLAAAVGAVAILVRRRRTRPTAVDTPSTS